MPAIVENLVQGDYTDEQIEKLLELGLIVQSEGHPGCYETTGLVWNDLGIEDDRCFVLFDLVLGKEIT